VDGSAGGGRPFRDICRRYAVKKPGASPRKYLDLKWWVRVNAARLRESRLDSPPHLRILDLGSGAGYFVYLCRRLGPGVAGTRQDRLLGTTHDHEQHD